MVPHTLAGGVVAGTVGWPAPYGIQALADSVIGVEPFKNSFKPGRSMQAVLNAFQSDLAAYKSQRLAAFQTLDARGRYEHFLRTEPELAQQLPAYHVASYLGMSEVTLSRLRHTA